MKNHSANRIAMAAAAMMLLTAWAMRFARADSPTDYSAGASPQASGAPRDLVASNNTDVKTMAVSATSDATNGSAGKRPITQATTGARIEGGQVNGHWREGTRLIEQMGRFRATGDRLSFTSNDGALHFDCLENLCGQRVSRAVTDSPEPLVWTVSGELTEFHGANYLLLSQAVLKPRTHGSVRAP